MQGRLSPQIDGKIQAFPWDHWQSEFSAAENLGLRLMEWTIDQDRLHENPLMTLSGQKEISELGLRHKVDVISLTGDCFMQAPFYKTHGAEQKSLLSDFSGLIRASSNVGIKFIVVPLVDAGRLETAEQEQSLISGLLDLSPLLNQSAIRIVFESDFEPNRYLELLKKLPSDLFGVNYDMGNSASLGIDPDLELSLYGDRIWNVHVKDRVLGGTTVPLTTGNVPFEKVFKGLHRINYHGAYILQTARAADGDHSGVLDRYHHFTQQQIVAAQSFDF